MFKNIIIPLDLSDKQSVKAILPKALNFATIFNAKLHFLYIISDFGMKMVEDYLPKSWAKDQKEKYRVQVTELIRQYVPEEIEVELHIGRGAVYDEIIQYANEVKADLIIISAVRPQLRDYMLGPNASKIVRHSGVSVLVVRE
ncbi:MULTISPECIES: universal stress protein [Rickettsieae]|uniref:universal stress protein n=1 Tax=Rickettsieae TaxID=33988 RepID=UPI0020250539|nr:universal stress protein [Rickettsia endosymbiont of Oedothorax gibbosus]